MTAHRSMLPLKVQIGQLRHTLARAEQARRDLDSEVTRLRRELAAVTMQRDLFEGALRESQERMRRSLEAQAVAVEQLR